MESVNITMNLLKKYISPILTVLVLMLFGVYLYKNPEIISQVTSVKYIYIVLIMSIYLFIFFLEGIFILITLKIFNKEISVKEGYFLSIVSRIGNYLLPMRAGAIFRATYLKKKYDFEYTKFLSTLYGYYIVFFLINSLIAVFVLLYRYIDTRVLSFSLLIFFSAIVLGMLFLIFVRVSWGKYIKSTKGIFPKIVSTVDRFITGWSLIVKDKVHFLILLLLALGNIFLNILVVYIEFFAIGKVMDVIGVILYTCVSGLSLLISVTPGSLGIREAAFLITSQSIGISENEIMQLAFLDRGIMFILLLLLLILILIFNRKLSLKEIFFGKEN